jgi:hypothetical protein
MGANFHRFSPEGLSGGAAEMERVKQKDQKVGKYYEDPSRSASAYS